MHPWLSLGCSRVQDESNGQADITFHLIEDIEAGQMLARQIHNEVIAPATPLIRVHMFAIAVLTAEFSVRRSETMAEAEDLVGAIADAARRASIRLRRDVAHPRETAVVLSWPAL
jgi:hypothetical protein